MRYLLKLSYDGTRYHGWQIQPNSMTVQGTLNEVLTNILEVPTETIGCGRTDTGVHALVFYAQFDYIKELEEKFIMRVNFLLPDDIRIHSMQKVRSDFNARFDAQSRSYEYVTNYTLNPFIAKYALLLHKKPNFAAMNQAALQLLKYKSFASFSKTGATNKTDFCNITEAEWREHEQGIWKFHITSDRFLRGMVRAIVGTLLNIGFEKITELDFIKIIEGNNRILAGESVAAHGLFLTDVQYATQKLNI